MHPQLITFDCYGTLIDWRGGVLGACRRHVPEARDLDEGELFRAFGEIENEVEAGEYRPYREVLRRTALGLAERFGWALDPEEAGFLAESLPSWTPFEDTNPALERLRERGHRLGIASNVDDDLLAATRRHFTVPFDVLITAERVRSYKPEPPHFRRALEAAGRDDGLLHVAQSWYHDVRPGRSLGIPVVWVNRAGEPRPDGPEPTTEVPDLAGFVAWLS